jgi:hypothetical protein
MSKVAIVSAPSGSGKTTFGRALAARLDVAFVETDALVHGAGWVEATADELRARLTPTLELDGWVIDGTYGRKIGDFVLGVADTVVWLDLPMRVWFPRLLRRTLRRLARGEEIWNGNRESWRVAFTGRDGLVPAAVRMHFANRKRYPTTLAAYPVVRLRSPAAMARFLDGVEPARATIDR